MISSFGLGNFRRNTKAGTHCASAGLSGPHRVRYTVAVAGDASI